jgi:hypothetical protein
MNNVEEIDEHDELVVAATFASPTLMALLLRLKKNFFKPWLLLFFFLFFLFLFAFFSFSSSSCLFVGGGLLIAMKNILNKISIGKELGLVY